MNFYQKKSKDQQNFALMCKIYFWFARPQAVTCEWQDRRQRPRMPKAPHVQW